MRRLRVTAPVTLALLATALAIPAGAGAETTITVEPSPGENSFAPRDVATSLSDASFRWVWGAGGVGAVNPHDVVQDDGLFVSGTPKRNDEFAVAASAGRFPYVCTVHVSVGMTGTLAVRPEAAAGYPGPFRVRWGSAQTRTGKRFDVRYKIERTGPRAQRRKARRSRWRVWRRDTKRFSGVFGRRGRPVRVRDGRTYRFRARSKTGKRRRSGWSPPLVVGPGGS